MLYRTYVNMCVRYTFHCWVIQESQKDAAAVRHWERKTKLRVKRDAHKKKKK